MAVLILQISDRLVELAVPGGPLTKRELGILRRYLELQEEIAPENRVEPDRGPGAVSVGMR